MSIAAVLARSVGELRAQDAAFALVGGLAVSARTEPRFTRDVDFVVAVANDEQAERFVHAFVKGGFSIESAVEQTARNRLATARLLPPAESGNVVDLLFASSGIEEEIASRAEPVEVLPGLVVPVAVVGDLIALKLLARDDTERPQDRVDLLALALAARGDDWMVAKAACETIAARGFHRDRDLLTGLRELREGPAPS